MTIIRNAWHFVGQLCAPLSSNFPIWVRQDDTARDSTLPYLSAIPVQSSTTEQRAKNDIERIGSTKREQESALSFERRLEIARNTDEGKQWEKRDEIRGRNSSCNDFHVERISLVNSHEKALLTRGFKTAEIFFSSLPFQFYHPIYVKSSLFT